VAEKQGQGRSTQQQGEDKSEEEARGTPARSILRRHPGLDGIAPAFDWLMLLLKSYAAQKKSRRAFNN
jgi:hypothetical protein